MWLSRLLKYSSFTNYISALNVVLKAEGCEPIDFSSHVIKTFMGGTKRMLDCAVRRAAPLLPTQFMQILALMSDRPGHVCTKAAILTGFRALLRKSQLADSDSVLLRSDFTFHSWGC